MTQPTKREQLAAMRLEDFKEHLRTIAGGSSEQNQRCTPTGSVAGAQSQEDSPNAKEKEALKDSNDEAAPGEIVDDCTRFSLQYGSGSTVSHVSIAFRMSRQSRQTSLDGKERSSPAARRRERNSTCQCLVVKMNRKHTHHESAVLGGPVARDS